MKKRFSRDRLKEIREEREGTYNLGAPSLDPLFDEEEAGRLLNRCPAATAGPAWGEAGESEAAITPPTGGGAGPGLEQGEQPPETGLISFTVSPREAGQRLDIILSERRPDFSRSQMARQAKEGLVLVDGRPAKASSVLNNGQTVTCPFPQAPTTELRPEPEVELESIYEDEDILVINKNWGLSVHPAPGYHGPTVAGGLLARDRNLSEVGERFRPGLVHRLDKDTSGVLITARNEKSLRKLAETFSRRETVKRYLAFVKGRPKNKGGLIDSPVGRHLTQRHKMAAGVQGGRAAKTCWRLLKHFPETGVSLILLTLITGRTHQARVHLQSLGTPVLADQVYSRGEAELLKTFPELAPLLKRQFLHARSLTIAHPAHSRPMTFRAPWPPDFIELFRALLKIEKAGN